MILDTKTSDMKAGEDYFTVPDISQFSNPTSPAISDDSSSPYQSDVDSAFEELYEVIPELKCNLFEKTKVEETTNKTKAKVNVNNDYLRHQEPYVPLTVQISEQMESSTDTNNPYSNERQQSLHDWMTSHHDLNTMLQSVDAANYVHLLAENSQLASSLREEPVDQETTSTSYINLSTPQRSASPTKLFMINQRENKLTGDNLKNAIAFLSDIADSLGPAASGNQRSTLFAKDSSRMKSVSPYPSPKEKTKPVVDNQDTIEFPGFSIRDEDLERRFHSLSMFLTDDYTMNDISNSKVATIAQEKTSKRGSCVTKASKARMKAGDKDSQSQGEALSCACKKPRLYNFLVELLHDPTKYTCIEWVDSRTGVFKILDSGEVARLWGQRKNKPNMKYENFARSLRTYVAKKILVKPRNKLVYQFAKPPAADVED